jgi:hypothetical protein
MANNEIYRRAKTCRLFFDKVISRIPPAMSLGQQSLIEEDTDTNFKDQLARFNSWAANIGVFADIQASLDYRLRDSPKVASMIVGVLEGLKSKLERGTHVPTSP